MRAIGMQRVATALLAVMAIVFVLARWLEANDPAWSWLRAFAEAALVGGLADWFAVTALFHHPLRLPIPHTAIIPANKDRIGEAFADFLERHFLTREVLANELAEVDVAALVSNCLLDPAQRRWLAAQALHTLVSEGKPGPLLAKSLVAALVAALVDVLDSAITQGLHDRVFNALLDAASRWLDQQSDPIYRKVSEKSPRWMPRRFNDAFFLRLMEGLAELLQEMRTDDSDARQHFTQAVLRWRTRLAAGELDAELQGALARPLQAVLASGAFTAHAEQALLSLGRRLATDPALRERLNRWSRRQAVVLLVRQRRRIAGLVRSVVQGWDAGTVAARIEGYVGRDLQYIRINGTVVGGLVGLALHALAGDY